MIGECPDCGRKMVKKHYEDAWDPKGDPTDTSDDWYCEHCGIRWNALEA